MYVEYACLDYSLNETDVQSNINYAIKKGITNIAVLPYSIASIKNLYPDISLICPLDYPFGLSDPKSRNNMVSQATKAGVSIIDLVTPNKILANRKYDKFRDDIKSNLVLCQENNVKLRYILEYRVFSHEVLAKVCQILKDFGIDTVLPSSGIFLDDINDNLIVCNFLNLKSGINIICNGNIFLEKHAKAVKKSGNYGARLYYKNSIDIFLSN